VVTVKRRLKRGALRGEPEAPPSGFRWLVLVDAAATAGAIPPGALLSQRAEEMARFSAALLAPYVRRIEGQAEAIGTLTAQLAVATSTNGRAATQQDAPPAASQAGRSRRRRFGG